MLISRDDAVPRVRLLPMRRTGDTFHQCAVRMDFVRLGDRFPVPMRGSCWGALSVAWQEPAMCLVGVRILGESGYGVSVADAF
jgi:hypothetical protein